MLVGFLAIRLLCYHSPGLFEGCDSVVVQKAPTFMAVQAFRFVKTYNNPLLQYWDTITAVLYSHIIGILVSVYCAIPAIFL